MIKRVIITIIAFLAFSCTKDAPPGVMVFSVTNGVPIIKTTVNGKGAKFIVDTGAEISIIDSSLRKHYGFRIKESDSTPGVGLGGESSILGVSNCVLKYNDTIMPVRFKTADLTLLRWSIGVVGVIGSDYLKNNKLIIDYSRNEIRSE